MSDITTKLKELGEKWANLPYSQESRDIEEDVMLKLPEVLDRIEQLERSCAEMRDALVFIWEHYGAIHSGLNSGAKINHALSTSCGKDYIHRDEVRPLVEALRDAQMFIESYFIDWELMATSKNYKRLFPEIVERLKQASTQAKQMIKGEKGEH